MRERLAGLRRNLHQRWGSTGVGECRCRRASDGYRGADPKAALGYSGVALGSSNPYTSSLSVIQHETGVQGLRTVGRYASPVWIGYGLGMALLSGYCSAHCAVDACTY